MKTSVKIIVSLIFAFMLAMSCNSDDNALQMDDDDLSQTDDDPTPTDDDPNNPSGELIPLDIQVIFPEGTELNLSDTSLSFLTETYEVDSSGKTTAMAVENGRSLAYLYDSEGEILMMGFLSEEYPILNIASTLEASLFFRFGTVFDTPEIKENFLKGFRNLPQIQPFILEMEDMFKTNPLLLKSVPFENWIDETAIALASEGKNSIDLDYKVLLNPSDEQSGIRLRIDEDDVFSVTLENRRRRRTKAFFYKTEIKKEGANEFETIPGKDLLIANNVEADIVKDIGASLGATSVQGTVIDQALGNGYNFYSVYSDPVPLELLDDHEASKYLVRVIGPGKSAGVLTSHEDAAKTKMFMETVVLDFIIPGISIAISGADIGDETKRGITEINAVIESANAVIASSPNALDALDEGDFLTATKEFFKALAGNLAGTEGFYESIFNFFNKTGIQALNVKSPAKLAEKVARPLTIINILLTTGDFGRIIYDISNSKSLESFEAIVSRSKVRIDPKDAGIVIGEEVDLKAKVIDDENVQTGEYSYTWTTTGKYGSFKDVSNTDAIVYKSDPNTTIPKNAKDSVFVSVFKGGNLIGKDSTAIIISPTKYQIKPDGLTIEGGDNIKLSIVDEQAKRLVNDETVKYKVVWSTNGQYGKLNSRNLQITTEEDHTVNYECFDKDTENGVEGISAKIYYAIYDELTHELSEYELYDEIQGEMNIKNDDDTLIFYVPVSVRSKPPTLDGNFWHWSTATVWAFEPVTEGIPENMEIDRYYMDIIERVPSLIPDCANNSQTWYPGNEENDLDAEGMYSITCGVGAGSGHVDTWGRPEVQQYYSESLARQNAVKGYAQVTVYLKPKS